MEAPISSATLRPGLATTAAVGYDAAASAVSWGAILAGAFAAAALALILLLLGTGLGLSAVSPWSNEGATAKTIGIAAIVWMIVVHLSSSAVGGYVAGRLRTKWLDVKLDEIFFRDTAHGLVAWAVGIVLSAGFLTSAATSIVSGTAKAGAAVAGAGGVAAAQSKGSGEDANVYFVDALFRSDRPREEEDPAMREEVGRVLANGLRQGDLPPGDKTYIAQVVAARTGLPQPEAEKRVSDAVAQAKAAEAKAREAADAARKAAAHLAMWTFLALLIGAFTASYAATLGGKHRDD